MLRFIKYSLIVLTLGIFGTQSCFADQNKGFARFLKRHDQNGDNEVSRQEFQGRPRAFERLDLNSDGKISVSEFTRVRQSRPHSGDREPRERQRISLPDNVKVLRDLEYASVDGESLQLDLYLPQNVANPPLIMWIHGGGWSRGDKTQINPVAIRLVEDGFALASTNYRLGGVSLHPKQVHDLKGAVRWLRANASRYGYDASRIGVGGGSAGGHLALLLGLSGGNQALEGKVGGNLAESSRVAAIVDLYGPSDLEAFVAEKPEFRRRKTDQLLRAASPIRYLSPDDPPLLIMHGDQDQGIPLSQSQLLHQRYQEAGLDSDLHVLEGAGHGGKAFKDSTSYRLIRDFFVEHLRKSSLRSQIGDTGRSITAGLARTEGLAIPVKTAGLATESSPPHGFHWMIGPKRGLEGPKDRFDRLLNAIDKNLSDNSFITGVYIIYHWRLLEPQEGRLDFTRLDRVIELVRRHHRYYKLAINPGSYTPDWLYVKGAEAFETRGSNPARRESYKKALRIPIPWDPIFQASYFSTLARVADRYAEDEAFRAVTLTPANFMSPEWHLPKSPDDMRRWQRRQGFPEQLERAWKSGLDRFASLFPNQYLVLEASSYPLGLKQLGDAVVDYGARRYAGRFAVQINQLNGRQDQFRQPGYRKLIEYKQHYGSSILIGLQNLKGWGNAKLRQKQGSEQMSAYNFAQARGNYWELWFGDGMNRELCEYLYDLSQEASQIGLDAFKQRLIKDGEFRPMG